MNREADRRFKYHHIVDVLLAASAGATPSELAHQVRERYPHGHYEPVRICEDIGRRVVYLGGDEGIHPGAGEIQDVGFRGEVVQPLGRAVGTGNGILLDGEAYRESSLVPPSEDDIPQLR